MEERKHTGLRSNPASLSLSLDGTSTNDSVKLPVIGGHENDNLQHGMLQNDEKISSLINDLSAPTLQKRGYVESENESAIELDDTNAHNILTPHSDSKLKGIETQNGVPKSVKKDDANRTNDSDKSPVVVEYGAGNLQHGMLQNDGKISSLTNGLNTLNLQQRGFGESENESAIGFDDTNIESSKAHNILAPDSQSEAKEMETQNGVPVSVKKDDADQAIERTNDSVESLVVDEQNNGNIQHVMLQNDEITLSLISDLSTPTLQQRGFDGLENEFVIELKDTNMELSNAHNILAPHSHCEPIETEIQNELPKSVKKDDANRVIVDTAAPFESVKEAVTQFGGSADWKAQRELFVERRNYVQLELKKVLEEIPVYQEQYEVAEASRGRVLMELDNTKRLLEELRIGLEQAETQEAEAKLDSELADMRLKEMEQGINNEASVAAKTQLEVAKERHASAIAELKSVKQELESMKREHASLVQERDTAIRKAEESVFASKEIEKTVEYLTVELTTIKNLIESAHSGHLEAEEQRIATVLAFDRDKLIWEQELKGAAGELLRLNEQLLLTSDLQSKLDTASTSLVSLKAELSSYIEAKSNPDVNNNRELKLAETNSPAALAAATKELDEARANIGKANEEVNCLRGAVLSLKSELEMEKTSLVTLRQRENLATISASSLEAEINRINTELELIMERQKEARDKMDLPTKLQEAAEEADQAKLVALLAHKELRKAEEEAEQAKDRASTVETRLNAARKETEAAKASEKLAKSALKVLEENEKANKEREDSSNGVTLPIEEYYRLRRKATEAEEIAKRRMASSIEKIKLAKDSESRSLVKLEETNRMIEEEKKAQRAALKKAEKAMEAKLGVEQELGSRRAEQEQQRKISRGFRSVSDSSNLDDGWDSKNAASESGATNESSAGSWKQYVPRSNTNKRSFLRRVVKFLARKKVQAIVGAALFLLFCCEKKYMSRPRRALTESQPTHNPREAAI